MSDVNVIYESSAGNRYDLKAKNFRIKEANFHRSSWIPKTTNQRYGESVDAFGKDPQEYEAKLMFMGGFDENREMLETLHSEWERDIITKSPGKIIWGDTHIMCYIISSSTYPDDNMVWTNNDILIYCPYPFWTQEQTLRVIGSGVSGGKIYPYTYPYTYGRNSQSSIYISHYADSDFRIVAYGPFSSFYASIGGNVYDVDYPALEGEYMVIDSRTSVNAQRHCYLAKTNGTIINTFDYRNPDYQLLKKIPSGSNSITLGGSYSIDLTVFKERSEPLWIQR